MSKYTIGLDFGTLSARAVVVDVTTGEVLSSQEHPYAHGVISKKMPCGTALPSGWALQDPRDYLESLEIAVTKSIKQSGVDPQDIIGLGVDFTASTTLPVLQDGTPVCFLPEYAENPHAYVKLWKHHAAQGQAARIEALARELDLPVIVHERDAHEDGMKIVTEFPEVTGVFHCYSGSAEMARQLVDMGWYIGFTGVLTFKNARKAVETAASIPLDRIVIETDCPFMSPEPFRGKRNDPSRVLYMAQKLAEIRGIDPEEAQRITFENGKRLYRIE